MLFRILTGARSFLMIILPGIIQRRKITPNFKKTTINADLTEILYARIPTDDSNNFKCYKPPLSLTLSLSLRWRRLPSVLAETKRFNDCYYLSSLLLFCMVARMPTPTPVSVHCRHTRTRAHTHKIYCRSSDIFLGRFFIFIFKRRIIRSLRV